MIQWRRDEQSGFWLFYCDGYRCWLRPDRCLERQRRAGEGWLLNRDGVGMEGCYKCKQGQEIKKIKEGSIMSEGLKYPCNGCGEKEALLAKNGTRVVHGLCRDCFTERLRAGRKRKSLEAGGEHRGKKVKASPLKLDFTKYAEYMKIIQERADEQLRTVEAQMVWDVLRSIEHENTRIAPAVQ